MRSLFNRNDVDYFLKRINSLTNETTAAWGKMDVAQMLTHCQKPFEIAAGNIVLKGNAIIRFLFGRRARKKLLEPEIFSKNLPTFPEAKIVDKRIFEDERNKLINLIEEFHKKGRPGVEGKFHPFFGDLTVHEWDALMVKHLEHHLTQFNA